jgi:hypothetical protein
MALYVDNSLGLLTTDELARIDDAMAAVDVALASLDLASNRRPFRLKQERVDRSSSPVMTKIQADLPMNSSQLPVINLGNQATRFNVNDPAPSLSIAKRGSRSTGSGRR